jgi:uncharacterized protein YkwD
MNKLIFIFAIFASVVSGAQSFPESPFIYPALLSKEDATVRLMNRINQYRAENGLNPFKLDTAMVNACAYHCNYKSLDTTKSSLHTESYLSNAKNMMTPIPYFESRMTHFKVKLIGNKFGEICCKAPGNSLSNPAYSQYAIEMGESCSAGKCDPDVVTELVFQMWKASKSHNSSMLSENGMIAGCYQYVYEKDGRYWVMATALLNSHKNFEDN